ncbi:MAG: hypothetical protein JW900_09875 [Anaerolineae bacterium]|nr:hypothetical protein [Anaerolineae bacterium]
MSRSRALTATSLLILLSLIACNLPAPEETRAPWPTESVTLEAPPPTPTALSNAPEAPTALNVPLQVDNLLDVERIEEPVTSGIPLPHELRLADPQQLQLVDAAGTPVAAQFTPLARWGGAPDDPSAPIRWLLVDFQATVAARSTSYYFLQEGGPGPSPVQPLVVTDEAAVLTVDTGTARFSIDKESGGLVGPGLGGPIFGQAVAGGTYESGGPVDVRIALAGPMRVSVHVAGQYRGSMGDHLLDYTARYWFYAGQSTVRLFYTVENNNLCPIVADGQIDCYDIGAVGSVELEDLSLIVPTDLGGDLSFQAGGAGEMVEGDLFRDDAGNATLYQDSSGTDFWDRYVTFTDWDGNALDTRPRMQSYVSFRGYQLWQGEELIDSGDQAAGWLSISGEGGAWAVGVRDFWQNFPKALRARYVGTLEIGLFPNEFGPPDYRFTLRPGEHKTHEIILSPAGPVPLLPLQASTPAEWYVSSGALGLTALPDWANWPEHEAYIQHQLYTSPEYEEWMDWYPDLLAAIVGTDFYGIFDYGDWPIDYEGYGVAPLNVKYDSNLGAWLQWARSGDPRWFQLADALNRHAADIDILHNLHSPRHWGDGITFGHSYHDEEGFVNPHRNYGGAHPDVAFGTAGMLLTYYLTGYEKAYESALELADCIEYRLHNDGHLCDHFADCNGEGWALDEGMYAAGSRPAANGLSIAVAAYRATADPRYLAVADAVVDWARPEDQPYIDGPTGEDQEMRPWMLNLYLRALIDYIELRDEFGLPDTYNARGAYLVYADWLRSYAWIDLEPDESGPRAAYPYEWWFDERQGNPDDEWSAGNNVPVVANWSLLGADVMAYAWHLSGEADYMDRAVRLFRSGSRDPWYAGDVSSYSETKQTINSISFGHVFLHEQQVTR